jgi:cytoskeletal protein CcmA (bactofilin family)
VKSKKAKAKRKGSALLIVLFIVMAITILSLGFLSRSDVELACGQNMVLRTQMDYLAESGLEHARGLILNSNDFLGNWTAYTQQLNSGNDYYDINVVQLGNCNYKITCDAYREKGVEKTGSSSLEAELRLNPCIAFWTQIGATIPTNSVINGDVYCNGTLTNNGTINGDVFVNSLGGSGSIKGQRKTPGDLSLTWPRVTVGDFTSHYPVQTIDVNTLVNTSIGSSAMVCYCNKDLKLAGSVQIEGMLIVDADLTISGSGNVITAGDNLPAMLVTGNLIIENGGQIGINGLAVVKGEIQVSAGAPGVVSVSITGGLFVENGVTGSGKIIITASPQRTAIMTWSEAGVAERWGQAGGAFFRSIKRK